MRDAPRPNWKWLLAALALASITLLLATACGGGEEKEEGLTETPTAAEESPVAGKTPAAGESPAVQPTPLDAGEELGIFSQRWAQSSGKVTYDYSSGSGGQTDEGSMTLYWRPPDWRMDFASGDQGEVIMIVAGDESYVCSEDSCISIGSPESPLVPPLPFLGDFSDPDALSSSIAEEIAGVEIKKTTARIADQAAGCYSVSSSAAEAAAEWCFGLDGLLLRFVSSSPAAEGGGEFRLEATAVDREVSDSDFEPPFPVTELPNQ